MPAAIGDLLGRAQEALALENVPESRASAEFLMASLLGAGRSELQARGSEILGPREESLFREMIDQRLKRLPIAHILREADFMDLRLKITPDVLIPRPETEELCAEAFRLMKGRGTFRAADLGTGSGAIALSLARRFPRAEVAATDISPEALAVAEDNASRLGLDGRVSFIKEDFFGPTALLDGAFDLVLSNPPYIYSARIADLEPEVLREPLLALDGGPDGLRAVKAVVRASARLLKPGGFVLIEIGHDQADAVGEELASAGLVRPRILKDFGGFDRIARAEKPGDD